jgi:hypothetical protein
LTSNRVARWVIELQQYDLKICHITGSRNFLVDGLNRNPAGLRKDELLDLRQPAILMVHAIHINIDPSVKRELKDLATHQAADQRLATIIEGLDKYPVQVETKYKMSDGTLYNMDQKRHQFCRPMLPSALDNLVIKYVHTSIGHLGVDKCVDQIAHSFHIKNLSRKVRRFIARCDTCQRVKYPNKSYATQERSFSWETGRSLCLGSVWGITNG